MFSVNQSLCDVYFHYCYVGLIVAFYLDCKSMKSFAWSKYSKEKCLRFLGPWQT